MSVVLFIIPVQRIMLDLGPGGQQLPPELELDVLQRVAGDLDGADVGGVVLRADVVVLQDAARVEQVQERLAALGPVEVPRAVRHAVVDQGARQVRGRVEVVVDGADLRLEAVGGAGEVAVAVLVEAEPESLL